MKNRRADSHAKAGLKLALEVASARWVGGHRGGLRVLLVEDDPDHVLLARQTLEHSGHVVGAVSQGKAAIAALGNDAYDVVALDYQLPDITGLEALDLIKGRGGAPPVVMVTASGSEQVAVEALKRGAADYVVKTPGYERELARALELAYEQARADAAEAALRAELQQRAVTDYLTGLLNRGEMERLLKRELQRAARHQRALSFALMDVDGFKAINDTRGHPAGDEVLRHLAGVLRRAVRSSDSTARWGGDEFAVLLPEADLPAARAFSGRLQKLVSHLRMVAGDDDLPPVTVSAGVVSVHAGRPGLNMLLRCADRALYAAKAEGRGRAEFVVLTESADTEAVVTPRAAHRSRAAHSPQAAARCRHTGGDGGP
jgi:diguanylate cyclase (GGDEF)-like protein